MNGRIPVIGITTGFDDENNFLRLKEVYYEAVYLSGGLAVAIPPTTKEEYLLSHLDRVDGLLLIGGPDVDAKFFGEGNMPYNGHISPLRDSTELFLAEKAIERNIPLLGICRGIQIMNVAMGGTLYQDIYSQLKDQEILQHSQDAPKWYPTHDIIIEPDSWVFKSFLKDTAYVNSFHHQAIKKAAAGFRVTSRARDGIIESIEYDKNKFCVGVQWHPELMWQKDIGFLNLFKELVNIAGENI